MSFPGRCGDDGNIGINTDEDHKRYESVHCRKTSVNRLSEFSKVLVSLNQKGKLRNGSTGNIRHGAFGY